MLCVCMCVRFLKICQYLPESIPVPSEVKSMFVHFPYHDLHPIPTFSASAGSSLYVYLTFLQKTAESCHKPAITVGLFINSKCFCSLTLTMIYLPQPQSVPDLNHHALVDEQML